jgi:hypothetical protein
MLAPQCHRARNRSPSPYHIPESTERQRAEPLAFLSNGMPHLVLRKQPPLRCDCCPHFTQYFDATSRSGQQFACAGIDPQFHLAHVAGNCDERPQEITRRIGCRRRGCANLLRSCLRARVQERAAPEVGAEPHNLDRGFGVAGSVPPFPIAGKLALRSGFWKPRSWSRRIARAEIFSRDADPGGSTPDLGSFALPVMMQFAFAKQSDREHSVGCLDGRVSKSCSATPANTGNAIPSLQLPGDLPSSKLALSPPWLRNPQLLRLQLVRGPRQLS